MTTRRVVFSLLFLMALPAMSQQPCLPGWNMATVTIGPDPNGCMWEVDFCYSCGSATAPYPGIQAGHPRPVGNPTCPTPNLGWIIEQLISYYQNFCTIPECLPEPDTCANTLQVVVEGPLCFRWHVYVYRDEKDSCRNVYFKVGCPGHSGYCRVISCICFTNRQPPRVRVCYLQSQALNVDCQPYEEPPLFECSDRPRWEFYPQTYCIQSECNLSEPGNSCP